MTTTTGRNPSGLSHSPRPIAVCTETTSAIGSPQKSADKPRTRRLSESSSTALRSGSGMGALESEVSVVPETALIVVQPSHALGRLHSVTLDRLVDLRLQ